MYQRNYSKAQVIAEEFDRGANWQNDRVGDKQFVSLFSVHCEEVSRKWEKGSHWKESASESEQI
jgi:hypothetical protein